MLKPVPTLSTATVEVPRSAVLAGGERKTGARVVMDRRLPKVSIGLPVYNGQRYLEIALRSLLGQTLEDFELIICDNASTDRTGEIARDFAASDRRIRYVRNETNIGANPNFQKALSLASGRFFKWAAVDDVHEPTYLEKCVAVLERDPSVVLAYSRSKLIDKDGRVLPDNADAPRIGTSSRSVVARFRASLDEVWCFAIFGVMRPAFLRACMPMTFYGSDKVLLAEMSLRGRFHRVEEPLFLRRCHDEQSTSTKLTSAQRARWAVSSRVKMPHQLLMYLAYTRAAWRVPMTLPQRLVCTTLSMGMVFRRDKWHKLLVPGPYNYLGLSNPPA